jgi:hypothetical protein
LYSKDPFIFDQGYLAQMVYASSAIHVTKRSVRFISYKQTIRTEELLHTPTIWTAVPCSLDALAIKERNTSSHAMNANNVSGSTETVSSLPTGSLCGIGIAAENVFKSSSQVLPCSLSSAFHPRIHPNTSNIQPEEYRRFLLSVPKQKQMCRNSPTLNGASGTNNNEGFMRQVELDAPVYDITHCDLHDTDMHLIFLPRAFLQTPIANGQQGVLLLSHSAELSSTMYWFAGILIVILVACLSQNIVAILQHSGESLENSSSGVHQDHNFDKSAHSSRTKPRGDVCLLTCILSWTLVLSTTEIKSQEGSVLFLTLEEQICYWALVAYGSLRIVSVVLQGLANIVQYATQDPAYLSHFPGLSTTAYKQYRLTCWWDVIQSTYDMINHGSYYNFVVLNLIMLSSRIHATFETPYILGLLFLIGVRMVVKMLKLQHHYSQNRYDISFWKDRIALLLKQIVLVGDGVLISVLLQAGVVPQFARQADGDACLTVFLFACILFGKGIVSWKQVTKFKSTSVGSHGNTPFSCIHDNATKQKQP